MDSHDALPILMSRAGEKVAQNFESAELRPENVSLSMYRVLATLARHDDQRLGDLAALSGMEVSTLSRLVGTMQGRRFVSRRRSGKDARAVRIRITDQGRSLAERLIAATEAYEASMIRMLSATQVQTLKRILGRVCTNMSQLETGGRGTRSRRLSSG